MNRWAFAAAVALVLAALAAVGLANLPTLYAELGVVLGQQPIYSPLRPPPSPLKKTPPGPALGAVSHGYWRVQQIAPATYAIGEPQDDPDNYEYLLLGRTRALLIDAGASARDIRLVLRDLTDLPVTVIPTHLHFDHTNGLAHADRIALIDLPETRALVRDGKVRLRRLEYLQPLKDKPPQFAVSDWIAPDGRIDLGDRQVRVLSTPGHTATSVSIFDPAARLLFTSDLIYTTTL